MIASWSNVFFHCLIRTVIGLNNFWLNCTFQIISFQFNLNTILNFPTRSSVYHRIDMQTYKDNLVTTSPHCTSSDSGRKQEHSEKTQSAEKSPTPMSPCRAGLSSCLARFKPDIRQQCHSSTMLPHSYLICIMVLLKLQATSTVSSSLQGGILRQVNVHFNILLSSAFII